MSNHKKVKKLQVKGRPSTAHSYFTFGPSETPVPLPQLPSWMLDTPMHSKLPMVPAPKGKIVLYTTGLGEKLHHTLSELEFDPNPQESSTEYHSLHDKHLRSYYCKPTKISRLIRNGFITPERKVVCTLKEFNDYQQHLKRVRLEKDTQDRKQLTTEEREERQRMRWSRPKTSKQLEHEQKAEDALERHKKMMTDRHNKLTQQQQERELKRIRVRDEKRRSYELELARKEKEQECLRSHKMKLFKEERRRKTAYVRKRSEEERRRAIKLEQRRKSVKDAREKKLEARWEQKILFQELQQVQERLKKEQENMDMEERIRARELVADVQFKRQKVIFNRMCESQAMKKAEKEEKIGRHLETKHKNIRTKYERKRKQLSAKYKRSGANGSCQTQKRYHCPIRSSAWEIPTCILLDICGEIEDDTIDLPSNNAALRKNSSQELPAVRRSGSGRTLSWHESMNDLSSKGRLPPITRSRLFNEEDEEMYSVTPGSSTSDVTSEQVSETIPSDDGQEQGLMTGICAPVIEIQLEVAVQDRSLEFTEDDYNLFMEMGSVDKIDAHTPSAIPDELDNRSKSPIPWPEESAVPEMSKSDVINGLREAFPSPLLPDGLTKGDKEETFSGTSEPDQETDDDDVPPRVSMTAISKAYAIVQNAIRNAMLAFKGQPEYDTRKIEKRPDEESIYSIASSTPYYGDDVISAQAVEIECIADHKTTDETSETDDNRNLVDYREKLADVIPEELPDADAATVTLAGNVYQIDIMKTSEGDIPEDLPDNKTTNDAEILHEKDIGTCDIPEEIHQEEDRDQVIVEGSKEMDDNHEINQEKSVDIQDRSSDEYTDKHPKEYEEEIYEKIIAENIDTPEEIQEDITSKTSDLIYEDDSEPSDDEIGYSLYQPSSILQSLMDIFGDSPPGEFRSSSEGEESEDEEDEDEEEIGFLENPNIVEETGVSCVSDAMTKERPFTEVISTSGENRVIVEGAIRRASSGDFVGHRGSITEAVLSIQNLSRDSTSKRLILEKVSGKVRSSTGDNEGDKLKDHFEPEEHYHQIIPLYHNHAVDVGPDLIDLNLSAISMKPDSNKSLSESVHTASRNSFRNIFRPDLTYCEGSAKCLRTTLLRQISHSSSSQTGSSHHANVMSVLDQSHHDVTAHHSDEEIVHYDDADGVCMRPMSRAFKVHRVIDDVVKEQEEADEENPPNSNDNVSNNTTCRQEADIITDKNTKVNQISEENAKKEEQVSRMFEDKSEGTIPHIVPDEKVKEVIRNKSTGDKISGTKTSGDDSTVNEAVVDNEFLDDQHAACKSPDDDIQESNESRVPDSIEWKPSGNNVKLVQQESDSVTDLTTEEVHILSAKEMDAKDNNREESTASKTNTTVEDNASTDDTPNTDKTKEGKVKRSQRRLSASHSSTAGRPKSSKHYQISQSKSAYSGSSGKHTSKISLKSSGTSTSKDGRKQSSTKSGSNTTSSSSLKKDHSIILVQPAKEKRSSCTVILTEKRSSQMSAKSSTKDLKTPTGAEEEKRDSLTEECYKESSEDTDQKTIGQNTTPASTVCKDTSEAKAKYASDLERFGRRHSSRIRPAKSLSPSSSTGITNKKKVKKGSSESSSNSAEVVNENNKEN